MPFVSSQRKNQSMLPMEEAQTVCDLMASLLESKNAEGVKILCYSLVANWSTDIVTWGFDYHHGNLGHTIVFTGSVETVDGELVTVERQTPYYDDKQSKYVNGQFDKISKLIIRDIIYAIMSGNSHLMRKLAYRDYDALMDFEGAVFELLTETL